jgi:uncharacterized protein YjhX (UPF0386 family)
VARLIEEPAPGMRDAPGALFLLWPHLALDHGFLQVDISRDEQRVLHALAQGGNITPLKKPNGRIAEVRCFTRDGWVMSQCNLTIFKKLQRKKAIKSEDGRPYHITRRGLELVRSEVDNR